jgi:hypothetical protein
MKTVQAVINLPESLYLAISCFGLTTDKLVMNHVMQAT